MRTWTRLHATTTPAVVQRARKAGSPSLSRAAPRRRRRWRDRSGSCWSAAGAGAGAADASWTGRDRRNTHLIGPLTSADSMPTPAAARTTAPPLVAGSQAPHGRQRQPQDSVVADGRRAVEDPVGDRPAPEVALEERVHLPVEPGDRRESLPEGRARVGRDRPAGRGTGAVTGKGSGAGVAGAAPEGGRRPPPWPGTGRRPMPGRRRGRRRNRTGVPAWAGSPRRWHARSTAAHTAEVRWRETADRLLGRHGGDGERLPEVEQAGSAPVAGRGPARTGRRRSGHRRAGTARGRCRRPPGLVVGDDDPAVVVELEPVDDAAQREGADLDGEEQLGADDPHRVGILELEVVADQLTGVGHNSSSVSAAELQLLVLRVVAASRRRLSVQACQSATVEAAVPGRLLPHQQLEGPVHERPLGGVGRGGLGQLVDGREPERQAAVLERGDLRGGQRGRQRQTHRNSG